MDRMNLVARSLEDRILSMQVDISFQLLKRWGIVPIRFVELDAKYGILEFIRISYEPFHLTGDEGIMDEIEEFISEQGGVIKLYHV